MATPHKRPFTPQQKLWVQLVVAGDSRKDIIKKVFHVDIKEQPELANRYDQMMWRWRQHPDYEKEWNAAYRELWGDITIDAMKELRNGLHDDQLPWRRTQHVNLALAYGSKLLTGDDGNVVKVQVVGMPDIGSPDQPEEDG